MPDGLYRAGEVRSWGKRSARSCKRNERMRVDEWDEMGGMVSGRVRRQEST
jgi:hypothetical protein